MQPIILIDAWNLIRTTPTLAKVEQRDGNAEARKTVIRLVREAADREGDAVEWNLIFDGASDHAGSVEKAGKVTVTYCAPRTADEVIVERASDATALGRQTVIVSNDREVRHEGAVRMWTVDFYEHVLQKTPLFETAAPKETKAKGKAPTGGSLAAFLVERGHLKDIDKTPAMEADLKHWLDYVKISVNSPNKLAKKIETQLRQTGQISPDPDPEKKLYRSLKEFFERFS